MGAVFGDDAVPSLVPERSDLHPSLAELAQPPSSKEMVILFLIRQTLLTYQRSDLHPAPAPELINLFTICKILSTSLML
jgi:hypothetical protein